MRSFATMLAAMGVLAAGCYSGLNDFRGSADDAAGADGADDGDGDGGDGADDGASDAQCTGARVGTSPLRRLTRTQYANTIRDLLGVTTDVTAGFSSDEKIGSFYSNGIAPITDLGVEKYMDAAEVIAAEASTYYAAFTPCNPGIVGDSACADELVDDLGRRAFRRPLRDSERAQMRGLYDLGAADGGFYEGVRLMVQGFLQSPYFLYHVEKGLPDDDADGYAALTGYEVASRLSYFLWDSMPDDELLDAAEAGELQDSAGIRAQAERMLADDRAKDGIASFHLQWLGVDDLSTLEKDAALFPAFDEALKTSMQAETAAFADYVIRSGDGSLQTLLTAPFSVIDAKMATLYGVSLPPGHVAGQPVDLDPAQRAGLITHASLLAKNAHVDQSSPVHRGVLLRENFLCESLPPPPENVDNVPPDPDPNATTRERFEQHTQDPACAGCHMLIDGLGFGMEHYDAIGAFRTKEGTLDVDASGEIVATTDIDGPFVGAIELAQRLSQSDDVRECVAQQWFNFAFGRVPSEQDDCSTAALRERFAESEYNVRELVLALVETDAFRLRRIAGQGQ